MTNQEIDREIAERVLELDNIKLTNFYPSVLIQDAWLVFEKMKEKTYGVRQDFIKYVIEIIKEEYDIHQELDMHDLLFHITPKIICKASLKVKQMEAIDGVREALDEGLDEGLKAINET